MKQRYWVIERKIAGGTGLDYVEICRCDSEESVAAVVRSILASAQPPEETRIRLLPTLDGLCP